MYINPNSKLGALTVFTHELTHNVETSQTYNACKYNLYYGKLVVEHNSNGDSTVYDIINIKKSQRALGNLMPMSGANNSTAHINSFSNKISQDDTDVKEHSIGLKDTTKKDEVIYDSSNKNYYTYENMTKLPDIKVADLKDANVQEMELDNYEDEFKIALNMAVKNGSDEYTNKSFGSTNDIDGKKVYVNKLLFKHAIYGSNNETTAIALENIYVLYKTAVPMNYTENSDKQKYFRCYYNVFENNGDMYIVRIAADNGEINNVASVMYSTNAKKGNTHEVQLLIIVGFCLMLPLT